MKLATDKIIMKGLNEGEFVDFSDVTTIEELKKKIMYNYVTVCRKCSAITFCKFYDEREPPCRVLELLVSNYIDFNIKNINTENYYHMEDFIRSLILLIKFSSSSINWIGGYTDRDLCIFFKGYHSRINSIFPNEILVSLSQYLQSNRYVEVDRIKEFVIILEGDSEEIALPLIFSKLGLYTTTGTSFLYNLRYINIKGKDRLKLDKIRMILKQFREKDIEYFIIVDNDSGVSRYINDLVKEGLIIRKHCLIWRNKFEDNFDEEVVLNCLQEIDDVFDNITLTELITENNKIKDIEKTINKLMFEKSIPTQFRYFKIELAKKICVKINEIIEKRKEEENIVYDNNIKNECFIKKLNAIVEEITKIYEDYHIVIDQE